MTWVNEYKRQWESDFSGVGKDYDTMKGKIDFLIDNSKGEEIKLSLRKSSHIGHYYVGISVGDKYEESRALNAVKSVKLAGRISQYLHNGKSFRLHGAEKLPKNFKTFLRESVLRKD